ncbi:MAG TPA: hypothetical protein VFQ76_10390, partial [Longimicrobiaceae bacterium]|nr:hypothetical protein [Longimicrobiaceae bacterium]
IYDLAQPFVWNAWLALGIAAAFLLLWGASRAARARRPGVRPRPVLVAAVAWAAFGLLEAEATRERADIRVDLLVTWPLLLVLSVACVAVWLRSLARSGRG